MSGGMATTNYTASLNYEDAEGIFRRSDNRELTGRINVGHSMWDGRLSADLNLLARSQSYFNGPDFNYAWRQALIRNPTDRPLDDEGNWQERGTYFYTNPLGLIEEQNGDFEARDLRLHGTLSVRPIEPLRFSLLVGTNRGSSMGGSATTFRHINTTQSGLNGTAGKSSSSGRDRILEFTGTYENSFGLGNVTLLG